MSALDRLRGAWSRQHEVYARDAEDERPLEGYAAAMAAFAVLSTGAAALAHREPALGTRDLVVLGAATHAVARIVAKDAVTSPLRAPFTRYAGPAGPGEVREEVRGEGARHAFGELLTCPFCLSPWVATALLTVRAVQPALGRHVTSVFAAVSVADLLQLAHGMLEQQAEG